MNAERERGKAHSAVYRYEKYFKGKKTKIYLITLVSDGKKTLVGFLLCHIPSALLVGGLSVVPRA